MSDGGVSIGRVSIRVTPDTSNFRRDLKADLEKIERNSPALEIDAVLNSKMLERHANAVVQRMNSKAERAKRKIIFDAELDASGLPQHARLITDSLDRYLRDQQIKILAGLDQEHLKEVRHELDDLVDDFDGKKVELQAAVDSLVARAELARVSRDRFATIHVQVSKSSLAKAETALAALSGLRFLGSTLDHLSRLFRNLDKNVPLIGTLAEAVMGLSAWLLAAASNSFALARDLAQLGGLALTLPGILGGIAFGLGATIAVLKDFNAVLPEVGREFSRIQDVMSQDFWRIAEGPIRNLTNTLLPQLEAGLRDTSTSLGGFFSTLATSLSTSLDGSLDDMFGNLAASINIASSANDSFAASIAVLGRHGAKYLPRLAGWYKNVQERMAAWLIDAERSGKLEDIVETAIVNVKDLGSVLRHTGGILAGVSRAAEKAGGSTLGALADTLERIHTTVDSPGFQNGLIDVLKGAHEAMNRISQQSGPAVNAFFKGFAGTLADGFRVAGDAIGSLLDGVFRGLNTDGFAKGFLSFLDGIRDGIRALAPMWEPLGNALGAIGTLVGELARQFGPLLSQVLISLSGMVLDLLPKLTPVIEALTSTLGGALSAVLPIVSGLVDAFTGLLAPLLSTEAGVIAVTVALVGFRLAVMAKGMEAGLASLLSFFGAESKARGMAAAIGQLGTKLGLIGAAVAATVGLVSWASQLGAKSAGVEEFSLALERLGNGKTIANVKQLEGLFQGGDNWLQESGESAADVRSLADAVGYLSEWDNGGWWGKFLGGSKSSDGLWMHSAAMKHSKDSVADLDAALAQMASSGNADAIANAQQWLAEAARNSGMSVDELSSRYLPEYTRTLESNRIAQEQAAQSAMVASAQQAEAMLLYENAIAGVSGISPGAIQAINDVSKEFIDLAAALEGEALPSVDTWLAKLEEQQLAMSTWADNMAILAQRGVTEGVLLELAKLGPEGAPMIAQLVNASDTELARLEGIMKSKTDGAVDSTVGSFATLDEKTRAELDKLPPEAKAVLAEMGILMEDGASDAAAGMAIGINSQGQNIYMAADGVARTAAGALSVAIPTSSQHGAAAAAGFNNGINNEKPGARSAGSGLANAAASGAGSVSLYGTGADTGQGFANGIMSKVAAAAEAAALMAIRAKQAAAGAMQIASPSRVMIALGEWVSIGFAKGIESKGDQAVKAMKKVASQVTAVDMADPLAGRGNWSTKTGSASVDAALADSGQAREVTVPVAFNGPVGGDPYEIAASTRQAVMDALRAEGLTS
ncbi:hypothetical protein ACWFNS_04725 [Oerskovia enterophila]